MSENVKITIAEIDKTTPAGRGTDSTDIAFIPGFSILPNAPTEPTLVTNTRDFEKLFGASARVLTTQDIEGHEKYGFIKGDIHPDRSYIFAKELLYQGMSVVYCNLFNKSKQCENVTISENTLQQNPNKENTCVSLTNTNNVVELKANRKLSNELVLINFGCSFKVPAEKTATFEIVAVPENGTIETLQVEAINAPEGINVIRSTDSPHVVDFVNTTKNELTVDKINIVTEVRSSISTEEVTKIEYYLLKGSFLDNFYGKNALINSVFDSEADNSLADKSVYSVKYITSGGYPSVVSKDASTADDKFASKMLDVAKKRGDAVALIDYQDSPEEEVYGANSVYSKLSSVFENIGTEYGACMYPWCTYNLSSANGIITMPASFAYLVCLAKAIKNSPNWLAMAGVSRGVVPAIQKLNVPKGIISNKIAEEMQPKYGLEGNKISINAITNIRPYGLTIWGNRTLKAVSPDGTVALNFLNVRNMLSDIKKLLYTTAKACMFEPDSEDLWLKFKDGIRPLLDKMKAGKGISDYKIVRGTTKYNGDPLTKGEISAVVKIYPMYAVEYFELTVEINDQEVLVD